MPKQNKSKIESITVFHGDSAQTELESLEPNYGISHVPFLVESFESDDKAIKHKARQTLVAVYIREMDLINSKETKTTYDIKYEELIKTTFRNAFNQLNYLKTAISPQAGEDLDGCIKDIESLMEKFSHRIALTDGTSAQNTLANSVSIEDILLLMQTVDEHRTSIIPKVQRSLNEYLGKLAREQTERKPGDQSKYIDNMTPEAKQDVVDLVTSFATKLGLDIVCKGKPCRFLVTGGTVQGRFQLIPIGSSTAVAAKNKLADLLPLDLKDNQVPYSLSTEWVAREDSREKTKTSTDTQSKIG